MLVVALAIGGYGIWLAATPDVQGGRDVAAAIWAAVALALAAVAAAMLMRP